MWTCGLPRPNAAGAPPSLTLGLHFILYIFIFKKKIGTMTALVFSLTQMFEFIHTHFNMNLFSNISGCLQFGHFNNANNNVPSYSYTELMLIHWLNVQSVYSSLVIGELIGSSYLPAKTCALWSVDQCWAVFTVKTSVFLTVTELKLLFFASFAFLLCLALSSSFPHD